MYSMSSFTSSAIPLYCELGRDLPKRGTLGGDNFPMLKAIHFYRSYLSSGFQARCKMELVCSSRLEQYQATAVVTEEQLLSIAKVLDSNPLLRNGPRI